MNKLIFISAFIGILSFSSESLAEGTSQKEWKLNTSNQEKLKEFRHLFDKYGISLNVTSIDLREVDAEPLTVATHKASQMPDHVLVEDTSLEIEGIDVGIHLRRKFEYLVQHMDQYVGKKATWTVLLAYKEGNLVYLYKGSVTGTFVPAKGEEGSSFKFLAEGVEKIYTEHKPECFDARALAVKSFIEKKPIAVRPVIVEWNGLWQAY